MIIRVKIRINALARSRDFAHHGALGRFGIIFRQHGKFFRFIDSSEERSRQTWVEEEFSQLLFIYQLVNILHKTVIVSVP